MYDIRYINKFIKNISNNHRKTYQQNIALQIIFVYRQLMKLDNMFKEIGYIPELDIIIRNKFFKLMRSRMRSGHKKYKDQWKYADYVQEITEELVDVANYAMLWQYQEEKKNKRK